MANIVTRIDNQLQANGGKALDAKMQPVETIEALNKALTDSTNKTGPFYRTNVYMGMVVVVTNPRYEYSEEEEEDVLVSTDPKEYIYTEQGWVEKDKKNTQDIAELKEQVSKAYVSINTNASGITALSETINNLPQGQTVYFTEKTYQFTDATDGQVKYTTDENVANESKIEGTETIEIEPGGYIVGSEENVTVLEKLLTVTNETTINAEGEDVETAKTEGV